MTQISGEIVLQELYKLKHNIFVIFPSGYDERKVMKRIHSRVVSFIQKPYSIDTLLQTVAQQLYTQKGKAEFRLSAVESVSHWSKNKGAIILSKHT